MPLSEPSFFVLFGRFSAGAFLLTGSRFGARCDCRFHSWFQRAFRHFRASLFFIAAVASIALPAVSVGTDGSLHTVVVLFLLCC